jgi:hypothetical protein
MDGALSPGGDRERAMTLHELRRLAQGYLNAANGEQGPAVRFLADHFVLEYRPAEVATMLATVIVDAAHWRTLLGP